MASKLIEVAIQPSLSDNGINTDIFSHVQPKFTL